MEGLPTHNQASCLVLCYNFMRCGSSEKSVPIGFHPTQGLLFATTNTDYDIFLRCCTALGLGSYATPESFDDFYQLPNSQPDRHVQVTEDYDEQPPSRMRIATSDIANIYIQADTIQVKRNYRLFCAMILFFFFSVSRSQFESFDKGADSGPIRSFPRTTARASSIRV